MKKTFCLTLITLGLTLGAADGYAEKDGYYRWKDDNGSLHFTQQPPVGRKYEFIESSAGYNFGPRTPDTTDDDGDTASIPTSPESSGPGPNDKMEVLPGKDPKLCEQAQGNLQSLAIPGARIRSTRPDGSSYFLDSTEIETQRLRAEEAVGIYCGQ